VELENKDYPSIKVTKLNPHMQFAMSPLLIKKLKEGDFDISSDVITTKSAQIMELHSIAVRFSMMKGAETVGAIP
jgi:hypothetical protein